MDQTHYIGAMRINIAGQTPARIDNIDIAACGDLYDLDTLAARLGLSGADVRARGLDDLVCHAWRKWGRDCVDHLNGDFAFILHDHDRHVTFGARDHIGAKPFYYALTPGDGGRIVHFSDHGPDLLAVPGVSDTPDQDYLIDFLWRGAGTPDATPWRDIRLLPAGCVLHMPRGQSPQVSRYWRPEDAAPVRYASNDEYRDAFLHLHEQVVADRLPADGPLGSHFSGGLDCSGIAVQATRQLTVAGRDPVQCFAWQPLAKPGEVPAPEQQWLISLTEHTGLPVTVRPPVADDLDYLTRSGIPMTSQAFTLSHEWPVMQAASDRGIRVMLSGWGGDEAISFNGRGYLADLLLHARLPALLQHARGTGRNTTRALISALRRGVRDLTVPWSSRMERRGRPQKTTLHPGHHRRALSRTPAMPVWRNIPTVQAYLYYSNHMTDRMQAWHAAARGVSMTYRYPLTDRRVMEFAYGLPADQFVASPHRRVLMRRAMATMLPPDIAWGNNKVEILRADLFRDVLKDALPGQAAKLPPHTAEVSGAAALIDRNRLDRLVQNVRDGSPHGGQMVRALQVLRGVFNHDQTRGQL